MKLQIIALRDSAAEVFGTPQFVVNIGSAARTFADQVNDPKSDTLYKHPSDFTLYHLGEYDDSNGGFALFDDPRQVMRGQDAKRAE